LAFGEMGSLNLPDELPASYRDQYGGVWLHDQEQKAEHFPTQEDISRQVEKVVESVKRIHDLD
jgi:hypothetical protein